ncbi:hypothetical protein HNR00_003078 [Methylorubrum rhodinum]|uniref:Uncharacterized protein n=1 Tax=Methylorubrum rhodinum TaxID=29428 RepID=A0A840ZMR3_9HYPH|nr:hypothetical protein [Methylorubrum rhodinum]MBB5758358.1 hypothetical protein [Methylorubrum rhodinum]
MFKVNVTVDTSQFSREVDAMVAEDLVPYLANVVDQLADGAIAALVEAQAAIIDRPKPFTQAGWRKGKPKPGPGGSVVTDVHLLPIQPGTPPASVSGKDRSRRGTSGMASGVKPGVVMAAMACGRHAATAPGSASMEDVATGMDQPSVGS